MCQATDLFIHYCIHVFERILKINLNEPLYSKLWFILFPVTFLLLAKDDQYFIINSNLLYIILLFLSAGNTFHFLPILIYTVSQSNSILRRAYTWTYVHVYVNFESYKDNLSFKFNYWLKFKYWLKLYFIEYCGFYKEMNALNVMSIGYKNLKY